MPDSKSFRVIIVGGGVAGLALANMLERANIDFILLERREIAPQLGASIVVQCNGGKILEQLGISQTSFAEVLPLLGRRHFDERGRLFEESLVLKLVMEKAGRPIMFVQRCSFIEALYDNIHDKSRIRTNTGITSFSEDEGGITVVTNRGENIRGSILVGADGAHSTIRGLLADSVSEDNPERYRQLTQGFRSNYRCVFGLSTYWSRDDIPRPLLPDGMVHHVHYKNTSGISAMGAKGTMSWFLFIKEEAPLMTPNCPRYTDTDAVETVEKYGHLTASPGCTFYGLWQSKTKAGMVPMEEGVVQGPWNNGGRVVLVGDSICRTTINSGFGGNLAVEGVCNLTNELVSLVQRNQMPPVQDITAVFERYERAQRPRAEHAVRISNYVTRYEATESLWMRFCGGYLLGFPNNVRLGTCFAIWSQPLS